MWNNKSYAPFLYFQQSSFSQILHGVSISIMCSGSLLMLLLLVMMTGFSALTKLYLTLFAHFSEISTRKLPVGLSVWIHQLAPSQNIRILALKLLFYLSQLWHCLQFQSTSQHVSNIRKLYIQIISFIFNFLVSLFSKLLCFRSFRLYRLLFRQLSDSCSKTSGFQYFENELGYESLYLLISKIKGSKTNAANNRVHCLKSWTTMLVFWLISAKVR